jgi:hypothetical protein
MAKTLVTQLKRYENTKYLLGKSSSELTNIDRLLLTKIIFRIYTTGNLKEGQLNLWAEVVESLFVCEKAEYYHDDSTQGGIFYEYLYDLVLTNITTLSAQNIEDLSRKLSTDPDKIKTMRHVTLLLCLTRADGKLYEYRNNVYEVKRTIGLITLLYLKNYKLLKLNNAGTDETNERIINQVVSSAYPGESVLEFRRNKSIGILTLCLNDLERTSSKLVELMTFVKSIPDCSQEAEVIDAIMSDCRKPRSNDLQILERFSNVLEIDNVTGLPNLLKDACDTVS